VSAEQERVSKHENIYRQSAHEMARLFYPVNPGGFYIIAGSPFSSFARDSTVNRCRDTKHGHCVNFVMH